MLDALVNLMKGDVDESITRKAPLAIALVSDPRSEFHIVDTSKAAQNMTLQALELRVVLCSSQNTMRHLPSMLLQLS
jgi:hypothetical protein